MWNNRVVLPVCGVLLCAAVYACAADRVVSVPVDAVNRRIRVAVGQELRITLGNTGPAEYEVPPQVSSTVISFLGVDVIPPFNPGGPTQQFRFQAVRVGTALIHFRRLLYGTVISTVDDTVEVH